MLRDKDKRHGLDEHVGVYSKKDTWHTLQAGGH